MARRTTDSDDVRRFVQAAIEYRDVLDRHTETETEDLLLRLEPILAELAAAALRLPTIKRGGPKPKTRRHNEIWKPLFDSLRTKLGTFDVYHRVFDPIQPEPDDPCQGSLSDDLADIYADLAPGLDAWADADAATRREIVWDWRFGYQYHFGQHLVGAMDVVHSRAAWHDLGETVEADT